ncbi:MAG: 2Fe-2S iron-sulfur cluster-binding protein, partial [Candidatus Electryonea clarkiae]|nr:2Fe-2S iron-sulfur cluster-binding protein [Candidatus Electryonea clarkiae]
EAARENDIEIPTLCYHPGLESIGACRLCLVEVAKSSRPGRKRLVTSCLFPVENGLIVDTQSNVVRQHRKIVLKLLIARVPDSDVIRRLADEYGVQESRYVEREDADKCIMCGTCVRVCNAMGANALVTLSHGLDKYVDVPNKNACIGCLACALNCPTNAIPFEETDGKRRIWGKEFDLVRCWASGEPIGTLEQIWHFAKRSDIPIESFLKSDKVREREDAAESVGVKL